VIVTLKHLVAGLLILSVLATLGWLAKSTHTKALDRFLDKQCIVLQLSTQEDYATIFCRDGKTYRMTWV
jgi:hypothetical protein